MVSYMMNLATYEICGRFDRRLLVAGPGAHPLSLQTQTGRPTRMVQLRQYQLLHRKGERGPGGDLGDGGGRGKEKRDFHRGHPVPEEALRARTQLPSQIVGSTKNYCKMGGAGISWPGTFTPANKVAPVYNDWKKILIEHNLSPSVRMSMYRGSITACSGP